MATATKPDPVMSFLEAVDEMCQAWDSLRSALDGSDKEMLRLPLDEGRIEMVRRTKRMADSRVLLAAAAIEFGKLLS